MTRVLPLRPPGGRPVIIEIPFSVYAVLKDLAAEDGLTVEAGIEWLLEEITKPYIQEEPCTLR